MRVVDVPESVLLIEPVVSSTIVISLLPTPIVALQSTAMSRVSTPINPMTAVSTDVVAVPLTRFPLSVEVVTNNVPLAPTSSSLKLVLKKVLAWVVAVAS